MTLRWNSTGELVMVMSVCLPALDNLEFLSSFFLQIEFFCKWTVHHHSLLVSIISCLIIWSGTKVLDIIRISGLLSKRRPVTKKDDNHLWWFNSVDVSVFLEIFRVTRKRIPLGIRKFNALYWKFTWDVRAWNLLN